MDEHTFSLPRLWFFVVVICVFDILTTIPTVGMPYLLSVLWVLPPAAWAVGAVVLPPLLGVLWLLAFALALKFHGRKSLWLLVTLIALVPSSLVWWIMVACALYDECL